MNYIRKTNLTIKHDQQKDIKQPTPGPGSYDIALPLIRPNYQAIRKKNDVVILKINSYGQSCNFRSQQQRFGNEKQKSPGPAHYQQLSLNLRNKKIQNPKYSQRYTDLIDFMYKDRPQISPIPDYKVQYENQYEKALRRIKNSHRRYKQNQSQRDTVQEQRKSSICSTSSIINIKSTSRLSVVANEQNSSEKEQKNKKQSRTIDYPGQLSNDIATKRPFSLSKQQNLLLHRETLYNRNMLGMLMVKKTNPKLDKSKISIISQQTTNPKPQFSTIDIS